MIPVLIKRRTESAQRLFTEVCSEISSDVRTIETLDEIFEVLKRVNL